MPSWLDILRVVAEPTRIRVMGILKDKSLSVAELQEIFDMGQSRISMHLRILKKAGLVEDHRDGQRVYYRWRSGLSTEVVELVNQAWVLGVDELNRNRDEQRAERVLLKRRQSSELFFKHIEERSKKYAPGRGWQAMSHVFLELIEVGKGVLADMGSGEGMMTLQLALYMQKVISIDLSDRMLDFSMAEAARLGVENIDFRQGDIEQPPLEQEETDAVLFSQALHHAASPERALRASWKALRPGGKIIVLDINQHNFEEARTLYGDVWLGFRSTEIKSWLAGAGFCEMCVRLLEPEEDEPHFQPLLATAKKPAGSLTAVD